MAVTWIINPFTGALDAIGTPGGGAPFVTGSGTATRVAFWSAATTLSSDSELYWDNTVKSLIIGGGTETGITIAGSAFETHSIVHDDNAFSYQYLAHKHNNTAIVGTGLGFARSRGTEGAETVVQDGDVLARLDFLGHDGTDYGYAANIHAIVDDPTPSATSMGGRLSLYTTPAGSQTLQERVRIANDGQVTVNTNVAFTHTSGAWVGLAVGGVATNNGGASFNWLELGGNAGSPQAFSVTTTPVARGVLFNPSVRNTTSGVAVDLGAWVLFGNVAQFRTNNTVGVTVSEVRAFADSPIFNQITGGSITADLLTSFDSRPTISTGATVTTRRGVRFLNRAGSGTQTDVIGFDYEAQTAGGVNYAFRNQDSNATITTAGYVEGINGAGNDLLLRSNANTTRGDIVANDAVQFWPDIPDPGNAEAQTIARFDATMVHGNLGVPGAHTYLLWNPTITCTTTQIEGPITGLEMRGSIESTDLVAVNLDTYRAVWATTAFNNNNTLVPGPWRRRIVEDDTVTTVTNGDSGTTDPVQNHFGFAFTPTFTATSATGWMQVDAITAIRHGPILNGLLGGDVVVTALRGLDVQNAAVTTSGGGTVTVTEQTAVDIADLTAGTLNLSLRSAGAAVQLRHAGPVVTGANAAPTNASVGLEVQSTTQCLLNARLTTAQKTTLTGVAVADGMQLYDSTLTKMQFRENGAWVGFATTTDLSAYLLLAGRTTTGNDYALTTSVGGTGTGAGGTDAGAIYRLRASTSGSAHTGTIDLDDATRLYPSLTEPAVGATVRMLDHNATIASFTNAVTAIYGVTIRPTITYDGAISSFGYSVYHFGGTHQNAAGGAFTGIYRVLDADAYFTTTIAQQPPAAMRLFDDRTITESNNIDSVTGGSVSTHYALNFVPTFRVVGASATADLSIGNTFAVRGVPAFSVATAGQKIYLQNLIGYSFAPTVSGGGTPLDISTAYIGVDIGTPPAFTTTIGTPVVCSLRSSGATAEMRHAGPAGFGINATPTAWVHVSQPTIGNEAFRVESVATNDDPNFRIFQYRGATTDATATNIGGPTLAASRTYFVEARVVARRTGGAAGTADDGAIYRRRAAYQGTGPTLIGAVVTGDGGDSENQAAWNVTLAIVGATIQVQVTGAANNNVTWHATVFVQDVGS